LWWRNKVDRPQAPASTSIAQLFLRYAAPLSGLRRLPVVGPFVGWASGKLLPRDTLVWAQVQNGPAKGLWLHLNPRTGSLYFAGGGEPAVQAALQEHLRPGMVFYDIGANIGFFSLLAARLVGPQGRVVAFEADPEVAARLREHISRNSFSWITAEQQAVWCEPITVSFARTDPATSPDRGLGHVVSGPGDGTIQVRATSLDEFTKTQIAPDFLKCDVEGAEVEVFRGAEKLLTEKRPGILCEMHSDDNRRILLEEFARHRYACTALDEHHVLALPQ
jgi:FkbM family methyltransferase